MPNKTIYVADADLPLFERAASIAGGLSPAVTAAIKLYVRREGKTHMPATQIIELDVTENGLTRRSVQIVLRGSARTDAESRIRWKLEPAGATESQI